MVAWAALRYRLFPEDPRQAFRAIEKGAAGIECISLGVLLRYAFVSDKQAKRVGDKRVPRYTQGMIGHCQTSGLPPGTACGIRIQEGDVLE